MAVENLASALGRPGKFQMILYLMLCCNTFFVSWNHLGMAFMGAKTKHHCKLENTSNIDDFVPIVKKGGKTEWDGCNMYVNASSKEKESCQNGWSYYFKGHEKTIISEVITIRTRFIQSAYVAKFCSKVLLIALSRSLKMTIQLFWYNLM